MNGGFFRIKEKLFKKGIARRLFSIVLALAMVISLMPMNSMTVYAAGENGSATFNDNGTTKTLTWAQLKDFTNASKYDYNNNAITDASIGGSAFFGCENLTSVTIPASIRTIGA